MIWVDYAILAVIAISAIISLFRGFIREVMSLASWVVAALLATKFSGEAAVFLQDYVSVPSVRLGLAFIAIFVLLLIIGAIVSSLLAKLVETTGLSGTDRSLGMLFGVIRGILIVTLLVLLAGLTPVNEDPWWKESQFIPHLEKLAVQIRGFMPENMADLIRFAPEEPAESSADSSGSEPSPNGDQAPAGSPGS